MLNQFNNFFLFKNFKTKLFLESKEALKEKGRLKVTKFEHSICKDILHEAQDTYLKRKFGEEGDFDIQELVNQEKRKKTNKVSHNEKNDKKKQNLEVKKKIFLLYCY